ncbi:MFS transporter [Algihabitans sp.]|uniref:MFS transporter n=1 Tax=Algihabitans sp. TaxID=2821514 RepID=UPI003BACC2FC
MNRSAAEVGAAAPSARLATVVLLTTAVQTIGSWAVLSFPALAPEIGGSLAIAPVLVGSLISLVYGVAMLLSLVAGQTLRRYGACRQSQAALVAFALACGSAASGSLPGLVLAGLLLGIGYGLINPATSHLLARVAPPERRNIVFSLKQTGVPLGGVLAGLATPALALAFGWQAAVGGLALISLLLAAALIPSRPALDDDREPAAPVLRRPLAGLSLVLRLAPLRWLSIAVFFLSAVQLCLSAYLVVFLVEEGGLSLVAAGALLAATQAAGFSGRLLWGWLADRIGDGNGVMLGLAGVMLLASVATALVTPAWPLIGVYALFLVFGITAIGWNGVFMAEVARLAPRGEVGNATAGALVPTFGGVLFGPSFFALAYAAIGSYAMTFGGLALAALAAGLSLVVGRRASLR